MGFKSENARRSPIRQGIRRQLWRTVHVPWDTELRKRCQGKWLVRTIIRPQKAASFAFLSHPIRRKGSLFRKLKNPKAAGTVTARCRPDDGGFFEDGSTQSIFGNLRIGTSAEGWGRVSGSLLSAR